MNKETLRMQMLSGVITESEYKAKLQENFFKNLIDKVRKKEEPIEPEKAKSELDGLTDEQALALYNEYNKQAGSIDPYDPHIGGYAQVYQTLANKLQKMYPNAIKESLNEHYVAGGIVGVGAINQIPSRAKADYEDAFEHFLGQKYEIKEEMEEAKEEVKEALQNDDMIYDRMMMMDQEQLISSMLSYAEQNPSVTLTDYLNDEFGYESEDELDEGKEVEEENNY
jgi:tRNA(Glu) U13 pseudouridine synthase TruD